MLSFYFDLVVFFLGIPKGSKGILLDEPNYDLATWSLGVIGFP